MPVESYLRIFLIFNQTFFFYADVPNNMFDITVWITNESSVWATKGDYGEVGWGIEVWRGADLT